ncbi:MAG: hypothetical protein Q9157_008329 [Trypethelium eluteriae]
MKDLGRSFDIFGAKDGVVPLIHTGAALPWRKILGKVVDMEGGDGRPFGYSFADSVDDNNAWSFMGGPTLLDEHESLTLEDFFAHPDDFSIGAQNSGFGNFGASNDLFKDPDDWSLYTAPNNVQTTSVGPISSAAPTTPVPSFQQTAANFGLPATSQQQPATSNQDLDAALALMGANSSHPQPYSEDPFFTTHQSTARLPNHHARHSISGPVSAQLPFGSATPGAFSSNLGPNVQSNGQGHRPHAIRFGSDASFHPSAGFVAPPNTDTHIEIQKRLVQDMNAMGHRESAPSTRATSPVAQRKRERSFPEPQESDPESSQAEVSEDDEEVQSRPKKRRRSTKLDIPSPPPLKTMPRRKSACQTKRRERNNLSGDAGRGSKHKENLTEAQKRTNHIQSEQKRRNIIKDGYNDLNKLVPNLREGGFSKSQALVEAASFLDEMVAGNKRLREMLNANRLDD